ncbi:MAG: hypothetical protein FWE03_07480, partial [Firmicutes bacterium]|nr:hypothetical protein [Bacillota bacterium]
LQTAIAQTNRTAQFRLFPDIGTGHTLLLSRLYFRIAHTDASTDRITLWASGAYRNSQFHGALLPENGNNHRVEEYRNSLLRSNLTRDFEGITSVVPSILSYILAHGTSTDGANAEDRIWIPSWQEINTEWGLSEDEKRFEPNGFWRNAWLRSHSPSFMANAHIMLSETGVVSSANATLVCAVRPALHLSLRALLGV